MKRIAGVFGVTGGFLASVWALGCGDDPPTPPPGDNPVTEVRNGTWTISQDATFTGPDSCLARPPFSADTTDILCSFSLIGEDEGFPVTCTVDTSGSQLTFSCTVRIDLGICTQFLEVSGQGTVTDTTFDLDFSFYERLQANDPDNAATCQLFYGSYIDACTTHVSSVGTWTDSGPTCTINGPSVVLVNADSTLFTASVSSLAEAKYLWSISGNGRIDGTSTGSSVYVDALNAGTYTLKLDVGRSGCPYSCQKTVTVSATPASQGPEATPLDDRDPPDPVGPGDRVPLSHLLSRMVKASLSGP